MLMPSRFLPFRTIGSRSLTLCLLPPTSRFVRGQIGGRSRSRMSRTGALVERRIRLVNRALRFQIEGLMYMSYTTAAVYDAVVAIEGGYEPYGKGVNAR